MAQYGAFSAAAGAAGPSQPAMAPHDRSNFPRPVPTVDGWKLFVGQLPRAFTDADLRATFEKFGTVTQSGILKYRDTGASKGCGFIVMSTKAEADSAIDELDKKMVLSGSPFPMSVKYADSETSKLEGKLFVGMMSREAGEAEVRQIFERYGTLQDVVVLRSNGVSKGCGFVKFVEREAAENAIRALDGVYRMEGANHNLIVRYAESEKMRPKMFGASPYGAPMGRGMGPGGFAGRGAPGFWQYPHVQQFYNNMPQAAAPGGYPGAGASPYGAPAGGAPYGHQYGAAPMAGGAPFVPTPRGEHGPPGANLFVFQLPEYFREAELAQLFAAYGRILSTKVFIDRYTNVSKGFGFVSFDNPQSAATAIQALNGFVIEGRQLKVQIKQDRMGPGQSMRPY